MRNWDYRYCWLRDTTFTLLAMTTAGYYDEAWPGRTGCCAPSPAVRIRCRSCTACSGERQTPEWEESTGCPVTRARARCASATPPPKQLQLDIYGELLDTFFHALHGMAPRIPSRTSAC